MKFEIAMRFEERLARAILDSQKIREMSYDQDEAESQKNEFADFRQFYSRSIAEASDEAVGNANLDLSMAHPIYLLNKYCWNDIQEWAKEIIK